jgi:hypothetical protein
MLQNIFNLPLKFFYFLDLFFLLVFFFFFFFGFEIFNISMNNIINVMAGCQSTTVFFLSHGERIWTLGLLEI